MTNLTENEIEWEFRRIVKEASKHMGRDTMRRIVSAERDGAEDSFRRQVYLCSGIGKVKMLAIIDDYPRPDADGAL